MEFRKARMEELDAITELIAGARRFIASQGIDQWQDGYPSRELIREDIEAGRGYVIADEEGPCGYCMLMTDAEPTYAEIDGEGWQFGEPYLTIHRIAAADRCRRMGIAGMLLKNAAELAAAQGITAVRADTHRGNRAMRGFLEKQGFSYRGEIRVICEGDPIRVGYERRY